MSVRAMFFGVALAAAEAARKAFRIRQPKAVVHVLCRVDCPPYFYVRVDDKVYAVRLGISNE